MWRRTLALAMLGALVLTAPGLAAAERAGPDGFSGSVERLSKPLRKRMTGSSWHEGCPVGLGSLRVVHATHWDFDGDPARGALVVHEKYAGEVLDVMRRLYAKRFPIRRMELVDRYGADDQRSMAHDNTSAFNCRFVNGTDRWSMHAYGKAVDINPRENPYVSGDFVSPPEGRPYADRRPRRQGMIFRRGPVTRAFKRIAGWKWAGSRAARAASATTSTSPPTEPEGGSRLAGVQAWRFPADRLTTTAACIQKARGKRRRERDRGDLGGKDGTGDSD